VCVLFPHRIESLTLFGRGVGTSFNGDAAIAVDGGTGTLSEIALALDHVEQALGTER